MQSFSNIHYTRNTHKCVLYVRWKWNAKCISYLIWYAKDECLLDENIIIIILFYSNSVEHWVHITKIRTKWNMILSLHTKLWKKIFCRNMQYIYIISINIYTIIIIIATFYCSCRFLMPLQTNKAIKFVSAILSVWADESLIEH